MSIQRPLLCMALFVSGCSRNECPGDISASLEQAVTSPQDSRAQVDAVKELEHLDKPVAIPQEIWLQGPSSVETKSSTEDLEGMRSTRLVKIDGIHYVYSGTLEGESSISLLAIRSFPDGKLRFVSLAQAIYHDE
jgi:hypothetical protein